MQNVADGHDTAVKLVAAPSGESTEALVDHDVPLYVYAPPSVPTATQNDGDVHETPAGGPVPLFSVPGQSLCTADQDEPLK
jgi:hypothetical protein